MIITKTPFRISFFGGGTDYHTWYQENEGQVLSTTINHFCYITSRFLPPFFQHNSRIVWSKIEEVSDNEEILHPVINAVLRLLGITQGVEVHHQGDLPARSGLASSSAFTVGMLNAIYNMFGYTPSKKQLASEAIYIEREYLKENVGVQDQIATAYGGMNKINIKCDGDFQVNPLEISAERKSELQNHLMLFFTGISRSASKIAGEKMASIPKKNQELKIMYQMVDESINILQSNSSIHEFGKLLHENWLIKRSLAENVSTNFIDEIYDIGMKNGALGGKILGAGGGGFILFFCVPENQPKLLSALNNLLYIPIEFENEGSSVIFSQNPHYTQVSLERRDFMHISQNNALYDIELKMIG